MIKLFRKKPSKELIELKYALNELDNHIYSNALMKDVFGNTGEGRNKEETTDHWNKYHVLTANIREKIRTLESKL